MFVTSLQKVRPSKYSHEKKYLELTIFLFFIDRKYTNSCFLIFIFKEKKKLLMNLEQICR